MCTGVILEELICLFYSLEIWQVTMLLLSLLQFHFDKTNPLEKEIQGKSYLEYKQSSVDELSY